MYAQEIPVHTEKVYGLETIVRSLKLLEELCLARLTDTV